MGLRSSIWRSSSRWVKSPRTMSLSGSSSSSWAPLVSGLKVTLMRSLGATEPSLAMCRSPLGLWPEGLLQHHIEIEVAQPLKYFIAALARCLVRELLMGAQQQAHDPYQQLRLPLAQPWVAQRVFHPLEQVPGQILSACLAAQPSCRQLPVQSCASAPGAVDTGLHPGHGGLETLAAQQSHGFAQGGVPGLIRWRFQGWRAGAAVVHEYPAADPGKRFRVGEGRAIEELQLFDAGKAPQEAAQLQLQLLSGGRGLQSTQALPDQMLAIKPEWGAGDAAFDVPEQFAGLPLPQAFLELLQPVGRQAAQLGAPAGVVFRHGFDRQPQQAAGQAHCPRIGQRLALPPLADAAGLFLQGSERPMRVPGGDDDVRTRRSADAAGVRDRGRRR